METFWNLLVLIPQISLEILVLASGMDAAISVIPSFLLHLKVHTLTFSPSLTGLSYENLCNSPLHSISHSNPSSVHS